MPRPLAVVTGASSGIGAVYADRLARRGHDLVLVARREDRLNDLAHRLGREHGASARSLAADLASEEGVATVELLLAEEPVTVLVNNAGLTRVGPFAALDPSDHARLVALNVVAPARLARAALPGFLARGAGTLITIASALAIRPYPGSTAYSASKAFVLSLSDGIAMETEGTGLRVQAVLPAATATALYDGSGLELATLPSEVVMPVEAIVDAALAGLDRGERVTLPSVANAGLWERFEAAQTALFAATQTGTPAPRFAA